MDNSQPHPNNQKHQKHQGGSMGMRGITRPMAEQEMQQHNEEQHHQKNSDEQNHPEEGHQDHKMEMTPDMRKQMLHLHHLHTLWVYWLVVLLGFWVLLAPLTFDYSLGTATPSGGR